MVLLFTPRPSRYGLEERTGQNARHGVLRVSSNQQALRLSKKPSELSRQDGKRLDGLTLIPFNTIQRFNVVHDTSDHRRSKPIVIQFRFCLSFYIHPWVLMMMMMIIFFSSPSVSEMPWALKTNNNNNNQDRRQASCRGHAVAVEDWEVRYMGRNGNRHASVVVRPCDVPDPWRSSRGGSRQEDEQICYTQPVLLVCTGRS